MTRTKASPRPWSVFDQQGTIEIHDATGSAVVFWQGFDRCEVPVAVHRANARLIVECVNAQGQSARVMKRELTDAERATISVTRDVHITGVDPDNQPVAQPANTDSVPGSPASKVTRPDQPKLPESGGIGGSSIGLGAEGEQ